MTKIQKQTTQAVKTESIKIAAIKAMSREEVETKQIRAFIVKDSNGNGLTIGEMVTIVGRHDNDPSYYKIRTARRQNMNVLLTDLGFLASNAEELQRVKDNILKQLELVDALLQYAEGKDFVEFEDDGWKIELIVQSLSQQEMTEIEKQKKVAEILTIDLYKLFHFMN